MRTLSDSMRAKVFLIIGILVLAQADTLLSHAGEPGQQFQGFNLQGYKDDGEKAWVVNGDKADIAGSEIRIFNVDAESYDEEKVNLTAQTGIIDQTSGNMHLEKDVVITSERGTQLVTDSLDWNRNKDVVKTKDPVVITDEGLKLTGTGMEAKPGLKTAQIHEDVTVTMDTDPKPEATKTVTITCDGPMVIDQARSLATFEQNVVAVQDDQTLKADRMEIYFDEEKKEVRKMICTGHVVIVRGENKSFADTAVYDSVDKKMTLTGRPKLVLMTEGKNAITAFGDPESR